MKRRGLVAVALAVLALGVGAFVFLSRSQRATEVSVSDRALELPAPLEAAPSKRAGGAAARMAQPPGAPPVAPPATGSEHYEHKDESGFELVSAAPLSTFSVDTDTASYSNVRRFLKDGQRPPKDAVRIEELINYFSYAYAPPAGAHPFSANVEVASCPWNAEHQLARVGIKGRTVSAETRKPANLVFLLDVSGSMSDANKLPLLQRSLAFAVNQLTEKDRVAIVVYAGSSGLVLPSTPFRDKQRILDALDNLKAGGSTNGGEGIQLAYRVAKDNFIPDGINRVILATDGDFNVGISDESALVELIQAKAKENVFLTVLGFGMGNLKDATLEKLADKGNGSYGYIDDFAEARKMFGEQIGGTLETIAKDVKLQVEFNPHKVAAYRLIGYENRRLAAQDFRDDGKDAGEIGAGHTVTALYELVPPGKAIGPGVPEVPPLKYQKQGATTAADSDELLTVKIRYKQPSGSAGIEGQFPVKVSDKAFSAASPDFRFASAVAAFGMLLSESKFLGKADWASVVEWAEASKGDDLEGHRTELVGLVRAAARAPATSTAAAPGDVRPRSAAPCNCPPGDPLCSCL